MKSIFCDICSKTFIIDIQTQQLENNVERVYFTCSHCNTQYTSYYTNVLIKRKQAQIKELEEKYLAARGKNPKQAEKVFSQIQKLKKEIGKDMDNLKKRVEASTK